MFTFIEFKTNRFMKK